MQSVGEEARRYQSDLEARRRLYTETDGVLSMAGERAYADKLLDKATGSLIDVMVAHETRDLHADAPHTPHP